MKKLTNISTIKQGIQSIYTSLIYNPRINRELKQKTRQFRVNNTSLKQVPMDKNIMRVSFDQFQDSSCLMRWGEVSDRDFGGSSKCEVIYNQYLRCLALNGKIDMTDREKLETMPFIGLIQKIPFRIKMGMFNCIRIQLIGDGKPISCEFQVESPTYGDRNASAVILTKKSPEPITYELPFRNFQIKGSQISTKQQVHDQTRHKMNQIIDQQNINSDNFCIRSISFRIVSTQNIERTVQFKKVEFVYTIRGTQKFQRDYQRPYFYVINDLEEKDRILDTLDIGHFELTKKKTK